MSVQLRFGNHVDIFLDHTAKWFKPFLYINIDLSNNDSEGFFLLLNHVNHLLNSRFYSDIYVNQKIRVCLGYFKTPKDFDKTMCILGCRIFS